MRKKKRIDPVMVDEFAEVLYVEDVIYVYICVLGLDLEDDREN